jgi:hypothetical protein
MVRLRKAVAQVGLLSAALVALMMVTATAAGAWSVPQQIDHTGLHRVTSNLITCPTSTLCVGAEFGPVVYHVPTGSTPGGVDAFNLTIPFGSGDNGVTLDSLICPSASECLGVADYNSDEDDDFDLLGTSAPGAGANAWKDEDLANGLVPTDLSCPTASFCAGTAGSGVVISQNPLGGNSAWTAVPVGTAGLSAVDCPSTSFCAGFDPHGAVWTSTDPTSSSGNAWTQSTGEAPLQGADQLDQEGDYTNPLPEIMSCSGPQLCLAIDGTDGSVLRSTDPTQANWTAVAISSSAIDSVNCLAGTTTCLAGDAAGEIFTSADGGATWSESFTVGQPVRDISCTESTCAAVGADDSGGTQPLLAPVPASGQPWQWRYLGGLAANGLSWIACHRASGCVGSDQTHYYASANPGRGVGSWTSRTVQMAGKDNYIAAQNGSCYSATGSRLAVPTPLPTPRSAMTTGSATSPAPRAPASPAIPGTGTSPPIQGSTPAGDVWRSLALTSPV